MTTDNHVVDELSALLDGEAEDAARIEAHLRTCSACAEHYRELKAVATQVRKLRAPEPRPEFVTRVLARVREDNEQRTLISVPWWRWLSATPRLAFAGGALAAAVIAAVLGYAWLPAPQPAAVPVVAQAPLASPASDFGPESVGVVGDLVNAGVDLTTLAEEYVPEGEAEIESSSEDLAETEQVIEREFLAMLEAGWESDADAYDAIEGLTEDELADLQYLLQGTAGNAANEG